MSRLSLNDWYRYLESQFEPEEASPVPPVEPDSGPQAAPTPEPPSRESGATPDPAAQSPTPEPLIADTVPSINGEQARAIVSIRVPHFAEFVPLLQREMNWQSPQAVEPNPQVEGAPLEQQTPCDGPRLRKPAGCKKRNPEAIVPPEADDAWAKLPQYLRYLAEWTDDRVTRKYYPVRGRDESREELIARLTDPVLTLEETARLLGVCPATVRRYTDRGWLRCFRTEGNQRRFKLSDIVAFLEEQAMRQPRGNRSRPQEETQP
ncbi:MAG: hypothetical protein KatS3mg020_0803 [Fimbriimonadales bacterium]|nr:MAG: hypothetical protein KatS3mg020_0803 [Fimbriimonadales bacterium]